MSWSSLVHVCAELFHHLLPLLFQAFEVNNIAQGFFFSQTENRVVILSFWLWCLPLSLQAFPCPWSEQIGSPWDCVTQGDPLLPILSQHFFFSFFSPPHSCRHTHTQTQNIQYPHVRPSWTQFFSTYKTITLWALTVFLTSHTHRHCFSAPTR